MSGISTDVLPLGGRAGVCLFIASSGTSARPEEPPPCPPRFLETSNLSAGLGGAVAGAVISTVASRAGAAPAARAPARDPPP